MKTICFRFQGNQLLIFILIFSVIFSNTYGQSVGIGSTSFIPNTSAQLEILSTTKGLLIPRLTTTQMNAITTPAQGLMIYNTTTGAFHYYESGSWRSLATSANDYWTISGTNIYNSNTGNVGIGITSPQSPLSVRSTTVANLSRFDGPAGMYISIYEGGIYRGYLGSYSGAATDVDFGTGSGNSLGKVNFTIQGTPRFSIAADGTSQIIGNNFMEFGAGISGKEINAGKIGYDVFGTGALAFVGAGTTATNRKVHFFAEGGTQTNGPVYLETLDGARNVEIKPTETGTDGAEIMLFNRYGTATIEIDADYADGDGRIITSELQINGGADLAEHFDVSTNASDIILPGMIVSIDTKVEGKLRISDQENDPNIVGVISGANGIKPGMLMSQTGTIAAGQYPIALAGRLYVLATDEGGPIQPGDMLTSSSKKGYAQKADSKNIKPGTIIGKAMGKMDPHTGYVLTLVNLQ